MEGGSSDKIMKREKEGEELGVGKKIDFVDNREYTTN